MKPLKKKFISSFLILFLSGFPLFADESAEQPDFSLSDIFSYKQPLKKGDTEKKGSLNLSGGYTAKDGNTESTNRTYGFTLKYDDNHTELKLNFSGSYGKLFDKVNENRGTGTLNFDYFLFWRIKFFSYSMSDYNKIIKLKHRNGTGAGAKIFFIRNDYLLVDLSGAPIYQYEKYDEQKAEEVWKWSVRGRIELFPSDNDFSIKYYAFYIPSIKNRKNYRTIQELTVYKKLAGTVGVTAGYKREYNTYDKEAFELNPKLKKTDSTTYVQATLNL
jgi:hypothetical protein